LTRGHTYVFSNTSGAHPFQIQTDTSGTAYNDGVTDNNTIGDVTFVVPLTAPNTLYYQCTLHPDMLGTINIIDEPTRPLTWNTSSVTTMRSMFSGATAFNQDISSWDVSNVTDMQYMFNNADAFNEDISSWDVSSVTNMYGMFFDAAVFNQDLSGWNVLTITSAPTNFDTSASVWVLPRPSWGTIGTVPLTHQPGTDPFWDKVISLIKVYNNNVHDLAPNGNSFVNYVTTAPTIATSDSLFGDDVISPLGGMWKRIENIPGAITVEAWIKLASLDLQHMFGTGVYEFPGAWPAGSLRTDRYKGGNVSLSASGLSVTNDGSGNSYTVSIPTNQWFHIAVQFDASRTDFWIDGVWKGWRDLSTTTTGFKFIGGINIFARGLQPTDAYTGPTSFIGSYEWNAGDLAHSVRITKGHRYTSSNDFTPIEFIEGPGLNTTPPVNPYV